MRLLALPLLFFAALVISAQSGSKIHIIHADLNLGRKVNNEQLRILKGAVHVLKDTINMYCDSAFYYEDRNKLELLGHVVVDNGIRKLYAQKIDYYPDEDLTECFNNVRVSGEKDSLFAQRLIYNLKTKEASAYKDVYLWSKQDNAIIMGEKGYFNNTDSYFRVTDNSHFIQIDTAGSDSFQVWAQKLEYFGDTLKYTVAVDSVKITKGDFRAHSDTAWYYSKSETSWLKGNPKVWVGKSELTGKRIRATFDSTKIKNINIYENAFAKTLNDSVNNEYNILKGKSIEFFLENEKPQLVIARQNASSTYYLEEGSEKGINHSTSDSIYVYFKKGELDSIEIIGGAQGTYFPESYKGVKNIGE